MPLHSHKDQLIMHMPPAVQSLIAAELDAVRRDPRHDLRPIRRIAIYDSFGPTYAPADYSARVRRVRYGRPQLTTADRVRARLALITARHVLPIWRPALDAAGHLSADRLDQEVTYYLDRLIDQHVARRQRRNLLSLLEAEPFDRAEVYARLASLTQQELDAEQRAIMVELLNVSLPEGAALFPQPGQQTAIPAWRKSIWYVPTPNLPEHLLEMAEAVLDGSANVRRVLSASGDAHELFGNCFGFDEEEFPAFAYDAASSALEALNQTLGLGPFVRLKIDERTTDEELLGEGAAAAAAVKAYAGVFAGNISTRTYDPHKRLKFWEWWLSEAIPMAWRVEHEAPPPRRTVPFAATVEARVVTIGAVYFNEDGSAFFDEPPSPDDGSGGL